MCSDERRPFGFDCSSFFIRHWDKANLSRQHIHIVQVVGHESLYFFALRGSIVDIDKQWTTQRGLGFVFHRFHCWLDRSGTVFIFAIIDTNFFQFVFVFFEIRHAEEAKRVFI